MACRSLIMAGLLGELQDQKLQNARRVVIGRLHLPVGLAAQQHGLRTEAVRQPPRLRKALVGRKRRDAAERGKVLRGLPGRLQDARGMELRIWLPTAPSMAMGSARSLSMMLRRSSARSNSRWPSASVISKTTASSVGSTTASMSARTMSSAPE